MFSRKHMRRLLYVTGWMRIVTAWVAFLVTVGKAWAFIQTMQ